MEIKITLTQRHIDAFCNTYFYNSSKPQTKEEFAIERILGFIEEIADGNDVNSAINETRDAAIQDAKNQPKATITKI